MALFEGGRDRKTCTTSLPRRRPVLRTRTVTLTSSPQQLAPAVPGHRARNVLAKVSAHDQAEVKADFWAIFDVGEAEPGDEAVAVAQRRAATFAAKWKARYPSAVACVTGDLASLTVHLRFPWLLCQAAAA